MALLGPATVRVRNGLIAVGAERIVHGNAEPRWTPLNQRWVGFEKLPFLLLHLAVGALPLLGLAAGRHVGRRSCLTPAASPEIADDALGPRISLPTFSNSDVQLRWVRVPAVLDDAGLPRIGLPLFVNSVLLVHQSRSNCVPRTTALPRFGVVVIVLLRCVPLLV